MFHRIRLAMGTSEYAEKLSGYIETDETYVGGKARNRQAVPYTKQSWAGAAAAPRARSTARRSCSA